VRRLRPTGRAQLHDVGCCGEAPARDNDARLKTTCRPDARSLQQAFCLAGSLVCSAAVKASLRLVPQREVVETVPA
jgi:hypothetical protein